VAPRQSGTARVDTRASARDQARLGSPAANAGESPPVCPSADSGRSSDVDAHVGALHDPAVQYSFLTLSVGQSASMVAVTSEEDLAGLAIALGGVGIGGPLSPAEHALVGRARTEALSLPEGAVDAIRRAIASGDDPLGRALYTLRPPAVRRIHAATTGSPNGGLGPLEVTAADRGCWIGQRPIYS
jgi:hypothetical protein